MTTIALILDSWTAFMWRRFGHPDVSQQVGQGRKHRPRPQVTQAGFWQAYLFVVLPLLLVGAWRAFA